MARAGWLNVDCIPAPGANLVADLRAGLPLRSASIACAVAMHVLQDLAYPDLLPVLGEIRRVLAPGGVLRAGVPDLERSMQAFLCDDPAYFYVPDDEARSAGAKLVVQAIWYGSVRTPFTWDFAREVCEKAGFRAVHRAAFGQSVMGTPAIAALDFRVRETLFFEAAA